MLFRKQLPVFGQLGFRTIAIDLPGFGRSHAHQTHEAYSMENISLLLTFVEERRTFSRQIQQQMREIFGDLVFDTVIHRDVRLPESPSAGESILTYAPRSRAAADYRALAREITDGEAKPDEQCAGSVIRRGIQKHLVNLFDGVWIPKGARTYRPGIIEST